MILRGDTLGIITAELDACIVAVSLRAVVIATQTVSGALWRAHSGAGAGSECLRTRAAVPGVSVGGLGIELVDNAL